MIYGANGYTGRLVVQEACKRGLSPVLAGRNPVAIKLLAQETGLDYRVFSLTESAEVERAMDGISLVLHCAGPFSQTSQPMIEVCLARGCHYLDITGEISVFANAYRQSEQARYADVVLIPGCGFDVVPTDCLAATLIKKLPAATALELAFESGGSMSQGTAKTSVEGFGMGGCARVGGQLKQVPLAWKTRKIPFRHGKRMAMTIPWGDVFSAYISTGVPDIEVYMATPPATISRVRRLRMISTFLAMKWVQNILIRRIEKTVKGPTPQQRRETLMQIWGEVRSADGRSVSAVMTTPNGYDVTATASLGIVQYLLNNEVEGGFYTPSLLLGADYATSLPGVSMSINT